MRPLLQTRTRNKVVWLKRETDEDSINSLQWLMENRVVAAVLSEYPETSLLTPTAELPVPLEIDTSVFKRLASANQAHVDAQRAKSEAAKAAASAGAASGAGSGAGAGSGSGSGSGVGAGDAGAGIGRRAVPPSPPARGTRVQPTSANGRISAMVMDEYGIARPAVERTASGSLRFQHVNTVEVRRNFVEDALSPPAAATAAPLDSPSAASGGDGASAAGASVSPSRRGVPLAHMPGAPQFYQVDRSVPPPRPPKDGRRVHGAVTSPLPPALGVGGAPPAAVTLVEDDGADAVTPRDPDDVEAPQDAHAAPSMPPPTTTDDEHARAVASRLGSSADVASGGDDLEAGGDDDHHGVPFDPEAAVAGELDERLVEGDAASVGSDVEASAEGAVLDPEAAAEALLHEFGDAGAEGEDEDSVQAKAAAAAAAAADDDDDATQDDAVDAAAAGIEGVSLSSPRSGTGSDADGASDTST